MQFTKACAKCRQQKTACRAGSTGGYPCHRCEESGIECILVEKNRNPAGPTLADRLSRQEIITQTLRAELDHLRNLVESNASYRTSATEPRPTAGLALQGVGKHSPTYQIQNPPAASSSVSTNGPFSDAERVRHNVRVSAIEELEQGHIPTNTLGDGARMLAMLSSARETPSGSRKRKYGGEMEDAKIAYAIFAVRCLPTIYFFDPAEPNLSAEVILQRSPLLFWAAVAVGSRESPELEETYRTSKVKVLELFRQTLGGPAITYWDLCGAVVYHKWLSPIRPIGHIVDLAYELGIHRTFDDIIDLGKPSIDEAMRIRLWLTVTIQDFYYSIASGCPPHYSDRGRAAEQASWLIGLPDPLPGDHRLAATFEYEELSHSLQDSVLRRAIHPRDWEAEVTRRLEAIEMWCERWTLLAGKRGETGSATFSMHSSVMVNYHQAKLAVNTICLQGVRTAQDVTPLQLKHIYQAVASGRDQCRLCDADFQPPIIQYVPESTIFAFISSAVFLMKVIRLLPSIDGRSSILGEISRVIDVLETLRDRRQGSFLREMLDHLQMRLRDHPISRISYTPASSAQDQGAMWVNTVLPQMESEISLDPNALWSLIMEDTTGQDSDLHGYSMDPFDWSVHLNSL